jgi:hypothetical protein
MALTFDEQQIADFAHAALPSWFPKDDEFIAGCAKMFGSAKALCDYWFGQSLIGQATGATATTPDWLAQHARDRATTRQASESDVALRERLRNVPDALTPTSILAAANAILVAQGESGAVYMVELSRDQAHSGTYSTLTGTGGTFSAVASGLQTFTPLVSFGAPLLYDPEAPFSWQITTTGAALAGNDVAAIAITAMSGDGAVYSNAGGAVSVDATVTWTAHKIRHAPYVADGFARAYSRRGYRSGRLTPGTIILILPYGSTAGTEASIREMLRQKKAAGFIARIERRLTPP